MLITYQIEPLTVCQSEIAALLPEHWQEVALDHDVVPFDPNWKEYFRLDAIGELQCMICRLDGKMVGYFVTIIKPHIHYQSTLHGFVDVYYVHPDHRTGGLGIKLFTEAEAALRKRGVVKLFSGSKLHDHLNITTLFERLGWRPTETLFSKILTRKS